MAKLHLFRDLILITTPKGGEKKTAAGFIVKEAWDSGTNIGTVVAVGEDVTSVLPNNMVYYNRFSALDVSPSDIEQLLTPEQVATFQVAPDTEYRLCREQDIMMGVRADG